MKVKVRYTSDYNKYPKSSLVAMLHDRDRYIERLQSDLYTANKQEKPRKTEEGYAATTTSKELQETLASPKKVKRLEDGPCFHGESWHVCPHCGKGVEWHSLKKTNQPNIYLCPCCKNEVTDRY